MGQLQVVTYLIEQKLCDPNVGGKQCGTLLHAVSVSGHLNIMKYLIDNVVATRP